jgi:hypothetical protein
MSAPLLAVRADARPRLEPAGPCIPTSRCIRERRATDRGRTRERAV